MQLLLRIIFPLLFSLLLIPQAFAAQEIGGISEVTGAVDILRGGKLPAEPAKVGDKVTQGDIIRTKSGGKAQIQFKDDSVLTIAPDSRVALNEYVYEPENNQRQASIKIFHGLVHTVVNKVFKKEKPDFTVETQTAVIGVRGTDYFTLVSPAISDIYNNSGTTEVRNIFAEIPGQVKLQGKEYTQVSRNLPPTLPLPLTTDDIKWLQGQMTPKMAAKSSGSGATGQSQLLSKVAGSAVETQNVSTAETLPGQTNVIQNLQSAVYVPPQPIILPPPPPPSPTLPVPFNIYLSWGTGAQDLDLYVAGPTGTIYYLNTGTPTSSLFYHLDSTVATGGEVITVNNLTTGAIYSVYVKDFTNLSNPSSIVLSNSSATMQFLRGGVQNVSIQSILSGGSRAVASGTPIASSISPPTNVVGNTWNVATINPSTGVITPVNNIQYISPTPVAAPVAAPVVTPVVTPVATPVATPAFAAQATVAPTSTVRPTTVVPTSTTAR